MLLGFLLVEVSIVGITLCLHLREGRHMKFLDGVIEETKKLNVSEEKENSVYIKCEL